MTDDREQQRQKNLGTAIALTGVGFAGMGILGVMSLVIPDIFKIILVALGLIAVGAIQYVIWGWRLDRNRIKDDDEKRFWENPTRRR